MALLLPLHGPGEWDRKGGDLHDKAALERLLEEVEAKAPENVEVHRVNGHIDDAVFVEEALRIFDVWRATGMVAAQGPDESQLAATMQEAN
ncbi:MAG: Tm-1-like ATP-binding domain-containing protein [Boseongicola sp.]|nr:Tm-1-like ATP-binding domain-containing protein [Boseongicola sp.]